MRYFQQDQIEAHLTDTVSLVYDKPHQQAALVQVLKC